VPQDLLLRARKSATGTGTACATVLFDAVLVPQRLTVFWRAVAT
jgi:hypothetical protein